MPIKVNPQTREVNIEFYSLSEIFQDLNKSGLWEYLLRKQLRPQIEFVFTTDSFGKWAQRKDNKPHPLLRDTRTLWRSLRNKTAKGNINRRTPTTWIWGTSLEYAQYHEQDNQTYERIPARPWFRLLLQSRQFNKTIPRTVDQWAATEIRKVERR